MKSVLNRGPFVRYGLCLPGLFLIAIMVTILGLGATSASGSAGHLGSEGRAVGLSSYSGPGHSAITKALTGDVEPSVEAGQAFSNTVFLPLAVKNYWPEVTSLFGVQIYRTIPQVITKTIESDTRWVRLPLSWKTTEPTNTIPLDYQWPANFEASLKRLADQDVEIILTFTDNPDWAATYPGGPLDKTDLGEMAEFLNAAVTRYSKAPYNVKYWELYNEPDNGDELYAYWGWGYWGQDPAAYAEMLATVYQPMKDANPEIQVVFGGLAYDWWEEDGGPFVKDFLDQVLENDGGLYFDVMNFHYYPNFGLNWDPYGMGLIGKATFLRDKLVNEYGLDKPFICTETAALSSEAHGGSHETQSRYVVQAFVRGIAADLDIVIWFMLQDESGTGAGKSGLFDENFDPKPSLYAYQTLVQEISPLQFVRAIESDESGFELIEGYVFARPDGAHQTLVAWTNNDADQELQIASPTVTVVGKWGDEVTYHDGDDGTLDGRVQVTVGPSPVYLHYSTP